MHAPLQTILPLRVTSAPGGGDRSSAHNSARVTISSNHPRANPKQKPRLFIVSPFALIIRPNVSPAKNFPRVRACQPGKADLLLSLRGSRLTVRWLPDLGHTVPITQ